MQGVSPIMMFYYLITVVSMLRMQNYDLFVNREKLFNVARLLDPTASEDERKKIVNQIIAFSISTTSRAQNDPMKVKAVEELMARLGAE